MKRLITQDLLKWKNKKRRKPLMLTGVRQCGKTYVCKEFGNENFEHTAYFNFEGNDILQGIFDHDFDVERIVDDLNNIMQEVTIIPGETLVIFDEIQECPRAITSLKYFCENMPQLHIICAGSLLGVALKRKGFSFPVGKVEHLQMYPMSFAEFVAADGDEGLLKGLQKQDLEQIIPQSYHLRFERHLKHYYIVGGMPAAVQEWTESHSIENVDNILQNILLDYESDFAKHAPKSDIPKLGWIWNSVPTQLAKENNKFVFSHVKAGKRSSDLEDALMWLIDAGLIYKLDLVSNPELPLSSQADTTYFKVYMSDVGLLRVKSHVDGSTILQDAALYKNYKGAFTENYCLTELKAAGITPYFWRSSNTAELDFVFETHSHIFPLEAKADIHTRAKSYAQYCKKYNPRFGFKFSMKNMGANDVGQTRTYSLPLYTIWRLTEYIKQITEVE